MGQFTVAEFRLSVDARLDIERHAYRFKSDPGIKPFGKPRVLTHRAQRRDGPRVEKAEIPGALRQAGFSDRAKELVEPLRQQPPQRTIDAVIDALGKDIFVAFPPTRDKHLDQFRRMLQIGIHDDGRGTPRMIETGRYGDLLAEIPAQRQGANARVRGMSGAQPLERIVGRSVVDKDDLEGGRATLQHRHQPLQQSLDIPGFIADRRDHGKLRLLCIPCPGLRFCHVGTDLQNETLRPTRT